MRDDHRRRTFLATAATVGTGAFAGCLGGETALSHGEVQREPGEGHLHFENDDGKRIATFSLSAGSAGTDRWRVQLHVWHAEVVRLASMRYTIQAPTVQGPMVQVFMKEPSGGPWPDLEFDGSGDETVVAIDELDDLGRGSLTLEFLLNALGTADRLPIRVFCEYGLAREGTFSGRYTAAGSIDVDLTNVA